mmetsp:Transcript_23010/g.25372  ORF Transcript_23010/g.25372 Transcript_23010/m.25372 type:complete len:164 (-) Transcript_23010:307-798(-)
MISRPECQHLDYIWFFHPQLRKKKQTIAEPILSECNPSTVSERRKEIVSANFLQTSTIYAQLVALSISPTLPDTVGGLCKKTEYQSIIGGRKVFADFINPDTKSSKQVIAVAAASESIAKRRLVQTQVCSGKFEGSQLIERTVTTRAQKLASVKRNAKKSKGK